MAKRRKTKKCPVCKVEVKADRLEGHMNKVHPDVAGLGPAEVRKAPRKKGITAGHWAAIAVAATIIVASTAAYVAMQRPSGEPGTENEVTPPSSGGQYPTDTVRIETSRGNIVAELYGNETPKTVKNFLDLVKINYYQGTIFHRVIPDFMIQGGGFNTDLSPKDPGVQAVPLEAKLSNKRGTLAMARTPDPNSATSQFYINVKDNPSLDAGYQGGAGYTVFGKVIQGMDVADAISVVQTSTQNGMENVPNEIILINGIVLQTPNVPQ